MCQEKNGCIKCQVRFIPFSIQRRGSVLELEIDMLFICGSIGQSCCRMVVPVLAGGGQRMDLPCVLLAGKKRYRSLRLARWGFPSGLLKGYRIHKIFNASALGMISYPYRIRLDYEQWMDGAQLSLG